MTKPPFIDGPLFTHWKLVSPFDGPTATENGDTRGGLLYKIGSVTRLQVRGSKDILTWKREQNDSRTTTKDEPDFSKLVVDMIPSNLKEMVNDDDEPVEKRLSWASSRQALVVRGEQTLQVEFFHGGLSLLFLGDGKTCCINEKWTTISVALEEKPEEMAHLQQVLHKLLNN